MNNNKTMMENFYENHWGLYVTVMALVMIALAHMGWAIIVESN